MDKNKTGLIVVRTPDHPWFYYTETKNLFENYPTEIGQTTMALRFENELFLSEIILSGLLDNLDVIELASVICAVVSEDTRKNDEIAKPCCKSARKVLNQIKDIKRKVNAFKNAEDTLCLLNK